MVTGLSLKVREAEVRSSDIRRVVEPLLLRIKRNQLRCLLDTSNPGQMQKLLVGLYRTIRPGKASEEWTDELKLDTGYYEKEVKSRRLLNHSALLIV